MVAADAQASSGDWTSESTSSYRFVQAIATGGMGRVDLALRSEGTFERLYAIKRLHPHLREDPDIRAMFVDEARIAGLLRHPNVVSVVDVGEDRDGPFLVMEYVEGVALTTLIRAARKAGQLIPLDVVLSVVLDAARGLAAAHDLTDSSGAPLSLVHRDVSPQNILLGYEGTARVTDFGIAKAAGRETRTSTGVLKGKLGYMAPEQLRFRAPDRRTDIFALGVVLFELVAGRRLYSAKVPEEAALRILEEPPPDLGEEREDVPPELTGLVFRMLAKDPEHRPQDAHAVTRALEQLLVEERSAGRSTDTRAFLDELFHDERERVRAEISAAAERARASARAAALVPQKLTPKATPAPNAQSRGWMFVALGASLMAILVASASLMGLWSAPAIPATPTPPLSAAAPLDRGDAGSPLIATEATPPSSDEEPDEARSGSEGASDSTQASSESAPPTKRGRRSRPTTRTRARGGREPWTWQ